MRKHLLLIILFTVQFSLSSQAQSLSLATLIAMQKGGLSATTNILRTKGWRFRGELGSSRSSEACAFPEIGWEYPASSPNHYPLAKAELYKYGSDCSYTVSYRTASIEAYNSIRASALKRGMKLARTRVVKSIANDSGKIPDGTGIQEIYQSSTLEVGLIISADPNSSGQIENTYHFRVSNKQKY